MFTCKLMVSVLRLQLIHPRHTTRNGRAKLVVTCGLMRELLMYIIGLQWEYHPIHFSFLPQFTKSLAEVKGFNASFL